MHNKLHCLTIVSFIFALILLSGCENSTEKYVGQAEDLQQTIYVCSDLHLLSNNVIPDVSKKAGYTSDGRVQAYDYELVQALVDKVNTDKPDALILTGDLSYNGEYDSHVELTKMLSKINKDITVLVIPGNHDTYMLDGLVEDLSTTDDSFRALYEDFGYTGGISYDDASLSYAYELSDEIIALMLDTTLCRYNKEESRNIVGGFIYGDTLDWMEAVLQDAKACGKRVISFTHHNLIDHNSSFHTGYTLINNEYVMELLSNYGVELNFSGHLHIQNIAETVVNEKTFVDIASSSLLTYSNTIGRLMLYADGFEYNKTPLIPFENFADVSFNNFVDVYYNKVINRYMTNYPENYDAILKFTAKCNALFFDGDYEAIHREMKANKKLLKEIKKNSNGVMSHFFEVPNVNQNIYSAKWQN